MKIDLSDPLHAWLAFCFIMAIFMGVGLGMNDYYKHQEKMVELQIQKLQLEKNK